MDTVLAGRKVLISGGASGIGLAAAEGFLRLGCKVFVTDLRRPAAPLAGARFGAADVRAAAEVDALQRQVSAELGPLDVLLCCAGVGIRERLLEGDPEKWAEALDVNLLGALRLIRAFVPAMLEAGGDVVLVSSVAAGQACPWGGPYAAGKAALEMAAETLRLETLPSIRVTTVAPGVVDTPFFGHMLAGNESVKELGFGSISAEQIAELIAYAVSRPPNMALNHLVVRPRGQAF